MLSRGSFWICIVFVLGSWGCGRAQWYHTPSQRCNPALHAQQAFAQKWIQWMKQKQSILGCLRMRWGQKEKDSTSLLVDVDSSGQIRSYDSNTKKARDSIIAPVLPFAAQQKQRGFHLFVLGLRVQEHPTLQKELCEVVMRSPSYVCKGSNTGLCWFSWTFSPRSSRTHLTAESVTEGCKLHPPHND